MSVRVADSNRDMFDAWNGDDGAHWARHADRYEGSAVEFREALLAAADVRPGMSVLDFGCGNGRTTREFARAVGPGGRVLGLDLSQDMLAVATRRAAEEGLDNVEFRQADVQVHEFAETFDVAASQFGSMFFGDRDAAFRNVHDALVPGGRIVLLTWQAMENNEWISELRAALSAGGPLPEPPAGGPGPFSLNDPDVITSMLTNAGFSDVQVTTAAGSFRSGDDVDDAMSFVQTVGLVRTVMSMFDDAGRERASDALRETMRSHQGPDGITYRSSAWLTTATA